VKSLSVAFDSPVTLGLGAVTVVRRGTTTPLPFTIASADGRVYQLDYTGGASLPDGLYVLKIAANLVRDSLGQSISGGDRAISFHRLFGDVVGDRDVDATDYRAFKSAMNRQSNYVWWLDYDTDGLINATDMLQLRSRMIRTKL
jgi:hypothetical protein